MMLIQIVILGALAAMAGASRTYDVGDWVIQFAGIASSIDDKLKEAGMSSSATNEEIYQILKGINPSAEEYPVPGIYTQFFDVDFAMRLGEILNGEMKIDCRKIYFNGVSELYHAMQDEGVSDPLRRYITDAYKKVSQFCTDELSANDWQKFDENLRNYFKSDRAEVVENTLGNFCDPDSIRQDDFFVRFNSRLKAVAEEEGIFVNEVLSIMRRVGSDARIMMKNMGQTVDFDKFNRKLKCIFTANLIRENIDFNSHVIADLQGKFESHQQVMGRGMHLVIPAVDFFEALSYHDQGAGIDTAIAKYAKLNKKSVKDVKSQLKKYCAKVDVDSNILAQAKTGLGGTDFMGGRFVAKICYDAKQAKIIS